MTVKQNSYTTEEVLEFLHRKDIQYIKAMRSIGDRFKPVFKDITKKDEFFKLISDNVVLIFYFNEINCNSCIESYVKEIEIYRDSIGKKNIIYLSKYTHDRDMYIFKRINEIQSEIFNISNLNLFVQNENVPMIFVLDKVMTINAVFFPIKEDLISLKYYLETIRRKYFFQIKDNV